MQNERTDLMGGRCGCANGKAAESLPSGSGPRRREGRNIRAIGSNPKALSCAPGNRRVYADNTRESVDRNVVAMNRMG